MAIDVTLYHAQGLTGGGDNLDGYSGAVLEEGDFCFTFDSDIFYCHVFDADGTDAEASPTVIRPDDYATAGVWKLLGSPYGDLQTQPEIVAGLPVTGGITGGNMSKTAANTVTISATSCLDSGLTTKLYTSADATVTIPSAANTIYHIFLVKLVSGGTFEFRAYTTEAGVASDAQVDKYRWIGFVRTNGSSNVCQFCHNGNVIRWTKGSENIVSASVTTSYGAVTHSSYIPEDRVVEIRYGARHASVDAIVHASDDGTNGSGVAAVADGGAGDTSAYSFSFIYQAPRWPYLAARQFKSSNTATSLLIHEVVIRR